VITPFATRAHNHNFKLDPCVRSLLDTDYYKLAMLQFIWKMFPRTKVSFSLINRKKTVRLADVIDEAELRRQMDYVRSLLFRKSELIWLAGNTFYGQRGIFEPAFIEFLANFKLPDYDLTKEDGQWKLDFHGTWLQTTMWEIYALSVINELRTRAALAKLSEFELDIFYARMKTTLWGKIERLRNVPFLKFADFGTRRRHSFLWQEYVITAMKAELPDAFVGTSNAYLAYKHDLEAIGTNAHELPMVLAALARHSMLGGISLKDSQYEVLRLWKEVYGGAMLIILPDTFGSTQFFRDAPEWIAKTYKGVRLDSKDPIAGGYEAIKFFADAGEDLSQKLLIPSDGLDVDDILRYHAEFSGTLKPGCVGFDGFQGARDFQANWDYMPKIRESAGWGTLLTNDARGCHPRGLHDFDPISLVCKVSSVEGYPAVKLSDNYTKATGPADEVAFYRETFGSAGMAGAPVTV
jgi:nicotinate phosphoribosyltransferase